MIKIFIKIYILCAFILLAVILYKNNEYSEMALGDKVNQTIYSEKRVHYPKGIETYKYMTTFEEKLFGYYDVDSSIIGSTLKKRSYKTSALFFLSDDVYSLKTKSHEHVTGDDFEHDFSEAHLLNHEHEEFYQIIYNRDKFICSTNISTDSVQCFRFMR